MGIDQLPAELRILVFDFLGTRKDLCSLCLTSRVCFSIAEVILYQDIPFNSYTLVNTPREKISKYCERATFLLGFEEDSGRIIHDDEIDVEERIAAINPGNEGDEISNALLYLENV
jgi:hypothetical protein